MVGTLTDETHGPCFKRAEIAPEGWNKAKRTFNAFLRNLRCLPFENFVKVSELN